MKRVVQVQLTVAQACNGAKVAGLRRAISLVLLGCVAASSSATDKVQRVFRCPGPPVFFSGALTDAEAKAKGCNAFVASPSVATPTPPPPVATKKPQVRKPRFELVEDVDPSTLVVERFYDEAARADAAEPAWKPRELGSIERWRYTDCQEQAAKAPTEVGVKTGLRLCRERFGQQRPTGR